MIQQAGSARVSNLGHLRQLTWLDLSFNNIRCFVALSAAVFVTGSSPYAGGSSQHRHTVVHTAGEIEGLDDLHELLDLSLYHNQIEEIKGHLLS